MAGLCNIKIILKLLSCQWTLITYFYMQRKKIITWQVFRNVLTDHMEQTPILLSEIKHTDILVKMCATLSCLVLLSANRTDKDR
jgi:hypothetical protein